MTLRVYMTLRVSAHLVRPRRWTSTTLPPASRCAKTHTPRHTPTQHTHRHTQLHNIERKALRPQPSHISSSSSCNLIFLFSFLV
eukprot:22878_5